MNSERKSEVSEEELPDYGEEDDSELYYSDDEYEDDEPEEREYCD